MKAVVYTEYGAPEVLKIKEVAKPNITHDEILVKLVATSVTSADSRLRELRVPKGFKLLVRLMMGFNKPKKEILGMNFSGIIEAVGNQVTTFKKGDKVFGSTSTNLGTYAEYVAVSKSAMISQLPQTMTFEEAAVFPFGALTALSVLKNRNISRDTQILINGASGAVGTATIQLAKYYGANVTGVCSTSNIELVKLLGADNVIDYTRKDFKESNKTYDYIIDNIGNISFSSYRKILKKNGKLLLVIAGLPEYFQMLWTSLFSRKKIVCISATGTKVDDLLFLKQLIESGKMISVIDRIYSLDEIVEAHKYVDTGRKKGNVVITVSEPINT